MPVVLLLLLAPPTTPQEAIRGFLRPDAAQQQAGLAQLESACTGQRRHDFRDDPRLLKALGRLRHKVAKGQGATRRTVLMALLRVQPCFSPGKLVTLFKPMLLDGDLELRARTIETLATTGHVDVLPALLDRFRAGQALCLGEGLGAGDQKICVWLAYGLGAALHQAAADAPLRTEVARAVIPWLGSPYAKVREVAVETLATAGKAVAVDPLAALIASEQQGRFKQGNSPALINRFEQRLKTLRKANGGSQ